MCIEETLERRFDLIALIFTHQAMVYKNARQLFSDCLGNERGNNTGIHTAGKRTQHLAITNLRTDFLNLILNIVCHRPIAGTTADFKQEIAYHICTFWRMVHLRMELHAIKSLFRTFDSGGGAGGGCPNHAETLRQLCHIVSMAHPADFVRINPLQKLTVYGKRNFCFAIFAFLPCMSNLAAQCIRHQLTAVADTQHRHAHFKQSRVAFGGIIVINAVRATSKDNALRILRLNFFQRLIPGDNLTINVMLPDTPRNQLIILATEIQYYNRFTVHI